tara:strand:- start:74 stop:724 length:651 start_codon:yes stop_codon:yes gene_type:complete
MKYWPLLLIAALLAACTFGTAGSEKRSMDGKTVYIVHGYMAGPTDHWFAWLKDEIEREGGSAKILAMPDSQDPDPAAWDRTLGSEIDTLDKNTFIVAHSLGTVASMRYLQAHPDDRIGGLILVSGFDRRLPNIPELDGFMDWQPIAHDTLRRMTDNRAVITAKDDEIVAPELSVALARSLDAELIELDRGGHFLGSGGFHTFPQVWQKLKEQASAR